MIYSIREVSCWQDAAVSITSEKRKCGSHFLMVVILIFIFFGTLWAIVTWIMLIKRYFSDQSNLIQTMIILVLIGIVLLSLKDKKNKRLIQQQIERDQEERFRRS